MRFRSLCCFAIVMLSACKDLAGTAPLGAGVQDPSEYNTPSGAQQQARGAISLFRKAFASAIESGGLIADELTMVGSLSVSEIDTRRPTVDVSVFDAGNLQRVRGQAQLARGALRAYAPDVPLAVRGEVYALEAYAELLLADLYCSGIPLSTIDFDGGFTYHAGSSTAEVYRHAAALFDTAATLAVGNDSVETLARVGWARALVGIDSLDAAARIVATVADTATYRLSNATTFNPTPDNLIHLTVVDREGHNGLPYLSSNDPRTRTVPVQRYGDLNTEYVQQYPVRFQDVLNGRTALPQASGVEARLIAAEADLRHGGTHWLTILNGLRTNGTTTVSFRTNTPGVSPGPAGHPDTTWGPGTGIGLIAPSVVEDAAPVCDPGVPCTDTVWYRGLHPLTDPGVGLPAAAAMTARVDLLFQERAFWLFLTGQRQGDLRRLIRQYGRQPDHVYPAGLYHNGVMTYGTDVTFPVAGENRNPLYKGCFNHGA